MKNFLQQNIRQEAIVRFFGILFLLVSTFLLIITQNAFCSLIFYCISIIIGASFILFPKIITLFSPIYILFSAIFIKITFPALYFFSQKQDIFNKSIDQNNIYAVIAVIYLIYLLCLILPSFFINHLPYFQLDFFKKNFDENNTRRYFIVSSLIMLILLLLLFRLTGFTYITALLNPLQFRILSESGITTYFRRIIDFMFIFNSLLLLKYNFTHNFIKKETYRFLKVFSGFHFLFFISYAIICGSRGLFINLLIFSIMAFVFFRKITIKALLLGILISILAVGYLGIYQTYRNYTRLLNSNITSVSESSLDLSKISSQIQNTEIFKELMMRLDSFNNSVNFFKYIDKKYGTIIFYDDFHIINQIRTHLFQPLPRTIIENKGYYFNSLMTKEIYPNAFDNGVGFEFGGISNSFWNFGILGIVTESFIIGLFIALCHKTFLLLIQYDYFYITYVVVLTGLINSTFLTSGFWNTMGVLISMFNLLMIILIFSIFTKKIRIKL